MGRIESFPIFEKTVIKFIEKNKAFWKLQDQKCDSKKYIYINLSMVRMQVGWVIPKLLFAKGMQEKTGCNIICLTWRENKLLSDFFESFGIKMYAIDTLCNKHKILGIKALIKGLSLYIFGKGPEDIKRYKVCGLEVGKDFYEDIIRTSSLSTIHSIRQKIILKKIVHLTWAMYAINALNNKYNVSCVIGDDMAYHEGAFLKLFHSLGADVKCCSNVAFENVDFTKDGKIVKRMEVDCGLYHDSINVVEKEEIENAKKLIKDRFEGKNGRNIDREAFVGKKVLNKKEMTELLNLNPKKKTIAIMAHTFADAVFNYGDLYFRDYYDWLDKTLSIVEEIDDVNWILKPHPTRKAYNESEDSVEDMYKRHQKGHIFWVPDDISSESIKNVCDAIVTIGSNAGAEYACFGIPAIIVGKPWYSGFGITIEPESYSEYVNVLKNINSINKLDDNQIETALKLFYMRNNKSFAKNIFNDELYELLSGGYKEMMDKIAISYFLSNDGTDKYNDKVLEAYCEYMNSHNVKGSMYYKCGYNIYS